MSSPAAQPRVAAILLAAGGSSRLGRPKQLVRLAGETLLERTIRIAREAQLSPILVVLGAHSEEICANVGLANTTVVLNPAWHTGMASSIRAGIQALTAAAPTVSGAVLLVCDQPALTASHLSGLAASGTTTASCYAARKGVPAFFPVKAFGALEALTGDQGARDLLATARAIDLPGGEVDIDLPEDAAALN